MSANQTLAPYTVEPHPDPRYGTWYVKEPAPIAGMSPHIIAICSVEADAIRVAVALALLDESKSKGRQR